MFTFRSRMTSQLTRAKVMQGDTYTRSHWQPVFTRVCLRLRRGESNHVALCYINTRLVCRARKDQEQTEAQLSARVLQLDSSEWKSCATRVMQPCWQSQQCLCDVTRNCLAHISKRVVVVLTSEEWRHRNGASDRLCLSNRRLQIKATRLDQEKHTRGTRLQSPGRIPDWIPDRNLRWDWVYNRHRSDMERHKRYHMMSSR